LFNASIQAIWQWDPDIEWFGAAGNHEMYTDTYDVIDEDFSTYMDFADYSTAVDEPGETELYYSFDRHGVHFIILDTASGWDDGTYTCPAAQMEWLEAELVKDYKFVIVVTHYPSFCVMDNRPDRMQEALAIRNTFHNLFVESGVDLVLSGHNHGFHHTTLDGIHYVMSAGGGEAVYDLQTEGTDWRQGDVGFSDLHYCVYEINSAESKLTMSAVLLNGTVAFSMVFDLPSAGSPLTTAVILAGGAIAVVIIVAVVYLRKR
jgi:hypothetical protein